MVSAKNSKLDFSQEEKQQQKQKQLFKTIYSDATSSEKLERSHASIPDKTEKNPHFGTILEAFCHQNPKTAILVKYFLPSF